MPALLPRRSRRNHNSAPSSLAIHNIVVGGHRTSVRLEPAMWDALHDIAHRQHVTVHDLVTEIDRGRITAGLTAAIRVYIVNFYRAAALHAGRAQSIRPPRLRM
jgi:predicted DNA-binding ribbon-helix-helix protein